MGKDSKIVVRGEMIGFLYVIINASKDVVNLVAIGGKNANIWYHMFGGKSEVGFKGNDKVGKDAFKYNTRKMWIPKVQRSLEDQVKEILSRNVKIF